VAAGARHHQSAALGPGSGLAGGLMVVAVLFAVGAGLVAEAEGQARLTGAGVLRKALALRKDVQDYVVDVTMHVELENSKIPDKTATVYFKRPDKLHVESHQGIFFAPKEAFMMSRLTEGLEKEARILLVGSKRTPGGLVHSLKIIPNDPEAPGRLLVWVNGRNWTVRRMEVWDGQRLVLTINWLHRLVDGKFWVPAKVTCELGKGLRQHGTPLRGRASFSFANYKINRGLSDEIFEED
ncbi:MAG: outer membrane lipoprotein carrier protein LolA, partial [Armatimonadota bacterium]